MRGPSLALKLHFWLFGVGQCPTRLLCCDVFTIYEDIVHTVTMHTGNSKLGCRPR